MTPNGYRLADSTAVEPLINHFAVWSDLISPLPYSLHMSNYQLKTLESYLKKPVIHLKAARNPKLAGGPFVDIEASRAPRVEELLGKSRREQADNISLAQAATRFQNQLAKEATGQSIEPLYRDLPDELRGYVELLYDYFNHPIVRFMESFLYESDYYKPHLQSLMFFRQTTDDYRRFFLSTPRFVDNGQLHWSAPFDDPRIDEIMKLDLDPQPLGYIREVCGLGAEQEEVLKPLLTSEAPPPPDNWSGPGVRIRYFGHACLLVEYNGVSIMIDPWIGVRSERHDVERLSYGDLPERIDFAMISHGHHDHFVVETLLRLRHRLDTLIVPRSYGMFYADTSLRLAARRCGFRNVVEVDALDEIEFPGGKIVAVPFFGEHADLAHGKSGYVVCCGDQRILLAADSNCLDAEVYRNIRKSVGPIQTAFLGMECVGAPLSWLYGALLPIKVQKSHDQSRRTQACNCQRGLDLIEAIGSHRVYNYAMGSEPWLEYAMGLGDEKEASEQAKESDRFLDVSRSRGIAGADRLFGKFELHLDGG